MTNIWMGGSFDPIHPGHVALFKEAHRLAATMGQARWVTVAVNTDDFIARFKPRPVQRLHDRMAVVAAMRYINEVQVNDGTDQADLILRAEAKIILVGDDWAPPRDYLTQLGINQAWLNQYGIHVVYLPRVSGLSSSRLKAEISARRLG